MGSRLSRGDAAISPKSRSPSEATSAFTGLESATFRKKYTSNQTSTFYA